MRTPSIQTDSSTGRWNRRQQVLSSLSVKDADLYKITVYYQFVAYSKHFLYLDDIILVLEFNQYVVGRNNAI